MRDNCKIFVRLVSEIFNLPEPIFEFGSLQVPNQEEYANLRPIFKEKKYIGIDMQKGLGVDIVGDIMHIGINAKSVGTVLAVETFEHVKNPFSAINEIHRVLKDEGLLIMTTPFYFKIHAYPFDYWRMTPSAYETLLERFAKKFICSQGEKKRPHTLFAIASKSKRDSWDESIEQLKSKLGKELPKGAKEGLGRLVKLAFRWHRKQKDVNFDSEG